MSLTRLKRENKLGNQVRKLAILKAKLQLTLGGICQNGTHTKLAKNYERAKTP